MDLEAFSERLTRVARDKGIYRPTDLARVAGLSPITVASYMRGTRGASLQACFALGKALNVDPHWLFGTENDPAMKPTRAVNAPKMTGGPSATIPVYSCALAGTDGSIEISPTLIDAVETPPQLSGVSDAYAVRVSGDSMEPRYESGETVYVHPREPIKKGVYVVAQVGDTIETGAVMGYIKKFVSADDQSVVLEQFNPAKKLKFPRNRVRSIHKIVLAG
jgi:phage repressor protein C with HTH and peptisase S24 domain